MENKDKVYVRIRGLHSENGDEAIEMVSEGTYRMINGKEYIKYDEIYEDGESKSTGIIRLSENVVEVTKKGSVTAHMCFETGKKTDTCYETPYGSLHFEINTINADIKRAKDTIAIHLKYYMDMDGAEASQKEINIEICRKK